MVGERPQTLTHTHTHTHTYIYIYIYIDSERENTEKNRPINLDDVYRIANIRICHYQQRVIKTNIRQVFISATDEAGNVTFIIRPNRDKEIELRV